MTRIDRRRGLYLTLVTVLMWGLLPVALKHVLTVMDAWTLTWFRFFAAALILGVWLAVFGNWSQFRNSVSQKRHVCALLGLSGLALVSNYVLYLIGLDHISPATAQLVIQLGPLLLAVSATVVFRERFSIKQFLGISLLSAGFALFFHDRFEILLTSGSALSSGVLLIVAAAVTWVIYALAQRGIQEHIGTLEVLFCICAFGSVVLLPWANPSSVDALNSASMWALFVFCCLNTIAAYGTFAESLKYWEASRASAVLALTPVVTMVTMSAVGTFLPGVMQEERVDVLILTGSGLVVCGSMLAALGRAGKLSARS